jgi:hypothetical protein
MEYRIENRAMQLTICLHKRAANSDVTQLAAKISR